MSKNKKRRKVLGIERGGRPRWQLMTWALIEISSALVTLLSFGTFTADWVWRWVCYIAKRDAEKAKENS